jgi:hypothetical protein
MRGTRASPPASTSRGAFDGVELVVLDFDLTLLRVHSFASRVRVEDLVSGARRARDDFVDVEYFELFLGARVGVARARVKTRKDAVCD